MSLIQSVLDLVNDPRFDKSVLTLKTVSDVFTFDASLKIEAASNRSRLAGSIRDFPPVVLDNVIDIIENERVRPFVSEGMFVDEEPKHPDPTREGDNKVVSTLASMSLVHPSWTWPAQMAMAREISIVSNGRDAIGKMRDAVSSIRCGPWTRRLFVDYSHSHDQPPHRRRPRQMLTRIFPAEEIERDLELSRSILTSLLNRTQNITRLSLSWSWPVFGAASSDEFFTDLFNQVAELKQVEVLSISGVVSQPSVQVMRPVARLVSGLPRLNGVNLAILSWPPSGIMAPTGPTHDAGALSETFGNAMTEGLRPPRRITALCVKIGEMLSLPLLEWIVDAPHIRHLRLCVGVESLQIRDQLDLLGGIAARANSFALLHTLDISSNSYQPSSQETNMLIKIIRHCISLRVLRLKPYNHLNMQSLLETLPRTLTRLDYRPLHAFKEDVEPTIGSFDSAFSRWLDSASFESSSHLMYISLHLSCRVYTRPRTEWDWISMRALSNPPFPTLSQTLAACERRGIRLQVDWDRTILPKPPTPPPIWHANPLDWTFETADAPEVPV
jgi:hypothetical protein